MKGPGMERFAGLALALAVSLAGMAGAEAGVRVVFDAFYPDRDAEYRDARLLEEMK